MKKKRISLVMALVLVLSCVIGGTLAWLTAKTNPVVNTFTVGDINITLTETTGDEYKMVPGNTIDKDPKVTVEDSSEDCWLFVKVDKSSKLGDYIAYTMADGWTALEGVEEEVYYRDATANDEFSVLEGDQVTVKKSVTKGMMKEAETDKPTLTFTAYAVQKANVNSASDAWTIATATIQ